MLAKNGLEIKTFTDQSAWRKWLEKNHKTSQGIMVRIFKKSSGKQSVAYDECLGEALCFGWIDGVKNTYDQESYLQKFTPRRPKSLWSKRNRQHIARLTKMGKMSERGLAEVAAAKKDGRWNQAYDSASNMSIPKDFMRELAKNKEALKFFKTLNKTNLYTIGFRLQTAKTEETKIKRTQAIIAQLEQGKKFH